MAYDPTKPYKATIKALIKETWDTPLVTVHDYECAYPVISKHFDEYEVYHTDGIGTKGVLHWQARSFHRAVQDALAMNLNDLAMMAAIPYALQNHLILPFDDQEAIEATIRALAGECKVRKIAMTGGETSIQDNVIGMDLSITVHAIVTRLKPNRAAIGDTILGIRSDGLHCNGFTLARKLLPDSFTNILTTPTPIYHDLVMKICEDHESAINAMMHIAGGAWTRIKEILPMNANAEIRMPHSVNTMFFELSKSNIDRETMYKTFNCGVGYVMTCDSQVAHEIVKKHKDVITLGQVSLGQQRVTIVDGFSKGKTLIL